MFLLFSDENIRAVVTTNEGKIYSNGLPLQLFETMSRDEMLQVVHTVIALLRRILTFPMVTVAAIRGKCLMCTYSMCHDNPMPLGHAFAGGAMLSLAHDYRVMRTGRGWFCLPEIKLKMLFTLDFLELGK